MINLILDLIFVAGFGMGAAGAAIATVISQAISFLSALIYLIVKRESFRVHLLPVYAENSTAQL